MPKVPAVGTEELLDRVPRPLRVSSVQVGNGYGRSIVSVEVTHLRLSPPRTGEAEVLHLALSPPAAAQLSRLLKKGGEGISARGTRGRESGVDMAKPSRLYETERLIRFRVSRPGTTRSGEGYSLRDQVIVPEPLSDHTLRDVRHLVNGVALAVVVPTGKLSNVAVQMLGAHVVVSAVVAPLEHGPE